MRKSKKALAGIAAATALVIAGVIGGGYLLTGEGRKNFPADGYVLEVASGEEGQSVTGLTFSAGTQYRGKFPASYIFHDIQGAKNKVGAESFIHYNDGSISAFTDGVAVNMQEVGGGFLEFYRIGAGMVMAKNDGAWEIDNNQNMLSFPELMWQLSEEKVLVASDNMTLNLSGREAENVSGYLEVTWLDRDVVQVADAEHVYQTVVTDGNITFANGAVLDFAEKAVNDTEGEALFTVAELQADMAEGAVSVQSDSAVNWQPPEFNIRTENGKDGEAGESGENGEIGENGESGESGEDGDYGEDGETGSAGTAGAAGSAGAAGATGAGGGSAGSGGSGGQGGSVAESEMGTIRLEELKYDCATISTVKLKVNDDGETLIDGTGVVEVRDAQTNRLIGAVEGQSTLGQTELEYGENMDSNPWLDKLSADREYTLTVRWDYKIIRDGNLLSTGTKTFVSRNFFTSSDGVEMEETVLSEKGLKLRLKKDSASGAKSYALRITVGGQYFYYPSGNASYPLNGGEIDLDIAAFLEGGNNRVSSDIPYTIELYTSQRLNDMPNWGADHEPALTSGLKKSRQILKGRTLKKKPQLGDVKAILSNEGYYELVANVNEDKDNSITGYQFIVTELPGNEVRQRIDSTTNRAKWYFQNGITGTFEVACKVTYFDNEKENMLNASPAATIVATTTGAPSLQFQPYKKENGQIVDATGTPIETAGVDPVNATRIWGDLILNMNGKQLDTNKEITIEVTSSDDTTYHRTIQKSLGGNLMAGTTDTYQFPVKCLGLKGGVVYTFSVTGTVYVTSSYGSATHTETRSMWLGSASVKTTGLFGEADEQEIAEGLPIAGFVMENTLNDTRTEIAEFSLYYANPADRSNLSEPNAVNEASPYFFHRSIARAVEISVYNGPDLVGTIVKELYDADWSTALLEAGGGVSPVPSEFEPSGNLSKAEKEFFFNGPLVNNPAKKYKLTNTDFLKAKLDGKPKPINVDTATGTYTLRISAIYDYSYGLQSDSEAYERNFDVLGEFLKEGVTYYNVMPLTDDKTKYGLTEASSVKQINTTQIDFGIKPPTLFTPAYTAVEVAEIKNDRKELYSEYDPMLQEDTTIGLKVASKFDDSSKQTQTITYYGMTVDAYQDFKSDADNRDIIEAARNGVENTGVKIAVTLDKSFFSGSSDNVPPLYVIFTKDPDRLNKCRKLGDDGGYAYNAVLDANKRAIFYTDQMERGHSYLFGFTLESLYRVDTMTGENVDPWVYPYEIGQKTNQIYTGEIQRSVGVTVYKETPRVAAYLDHTTITGRNGATEDSAVWKYLVYDPDGALWQTTAAGGSIPVAYAGDAGEIVIRLSRDAGLNPSGAPELLLCDVTAYQEMSENDYKTLSDGSNIRKVCESIVGVNGFPGEGRLKQFTVTVKNNGRTELKKYKSGQPYQIWLREKEFSDTYISRLNSEGAEVREEYIKGRTNEENKLTAGAERFKVATAENSFDGFGESVDSLNVRASIRDGSDNLSLTVQGASENIKKHIIGFYYELKDKTGSNSLKQWGFVPYNVDEGKADITLEKPKTGEEVTLEAYVIYDTGIAGLNRSKVKSSIHDLPKSDKDAPAAGKTNRFYALQNQSVTPKEGNTAARPSNYTSVTNDNYGLIFDKEAAAGSLYEILASDGSEWPQSDEPFFAGCRARAWNRMNVTGFIGVSMAYTYGEQGGYIGEKAGMCFPVLKALAEAQAALTCNENDKYIKNVGGTIIITTPPTTPNVDQSSVTRALHSASVNFRVSKKSTQTLQATAMGYDGKVYLELYDADNQLLPNTDNRYFRYEAGQNFTEVKTDAKGAYIEPRLQTEAEQPEEEKREAVPNEVSIRNLELGKTYTLKLVYYENGQKKTLQNAVPGGDVGDYKERFSTFDKLIISGGRPGDSGLTADYALDGYGSQKLTVACRISPTKDYYLRYCVYPKGSNEAKMTHDALMNRLGYQKAATKKKFPYYNGSAWTEREYDVYQNENGTEYNKSDVEVFKLEARDLNNGADYRLELQAVDLYTGQVLLTESKEFNVPPRSAITVDPLNVAYRSLPSGGGKYYAELTIHVKDDGYRLGIQTGSGDTAATRTGVYRVKLQKKENAATADWTDMRLQDLADGNADDGWYLGPADSDSRAGIFSKGKPYTIRYPVIKDECYRIVITGMDLLDTAPAEKTIYDSAQNAATNRDLTVPDLSGPQMKNMELDYDRSKQEITISVLNGANLEQIKSVDYVLFNMSRTPVISDHASRSGGFGAADSKGWQELTISLSDILEKWAKENNVESRDSLTLSVQYMSASGEPLANSTFTLKY